MDKSHYYFLTIFFVGVLVGVDQLIDGKQTVLDAQKWEWKISTMDKMAEEDKQAMAAVETEAMSDFVRKVFRRFPMPDPWIFGRSPQDVKVAFFTGLAYVLSNHQG